MIMRAGRWAALLASLALAGCGSPAGGGTPGGPVRVVATIYPLAFAAQAAAGPRGTVTTLTPPGVEPHDLELSPAQVAAISEADLVVYVPGLQPAVDQAIAAQAGDRALDATAGLDLLPAPGGGTDPHVWLDPINVATIAGSIAARLGDRADAAAVRSLDARLRELSTAWSAATATCASRDLVVNHAAFAYLARKYRFTQVAIEGISPDAEPGPARMAEVADFVRANRVRTIYTEVLVDPKVATAIAAETGARTALLDPLEGKPATGDYLTAMDANLAAVRAGQPCGTGSGA